MLASMKTDQKKEEQTTSRQLNEWTDRLTDRSMIVRNIDNLWLKDQQVNRQTKEKIVKNIDDS